MRGLAAFWFVVLAALGGGAAYLQHLGSPEAAPPAAAPLAPPEPPRAEAPPRPAPDPPPPPAGDAVAGPIPSAPEPPPLAQLRPPPSATAARPTPAPDPALQEPSPHGLVPRIGPEGRTAARTYSRAAEAPAGRPRVALVVGNIGLNASLSEEAIRRLPPETGLAFSPYAARPEPVLERARARGMEILSALPMEPAGYPTNDPGERALLTTLSVAENADRLLWILSRVGGQVGALGALGPMRGERFAAVPAHANAVQDALRARGLLYLDPRPGQPSPARSFGRTADVVVDEPATRSEIERRLAELERIARDRGTAFGIAGEASPVLVDRVAAWAAGLEERGVALVPVTALIRRGDDVPAR